MSSRFPISSRTGVVARLLASVCPRLRSFAIAAALALPIFVVAVVVADDSEELPELGDSAGRVLSPAQERQIGRQFRRQILREPSYIGDLELHAYLNRLGARVAENASLRGTPISVYLLQNPELNAFAVPGGHITFHTGLLLTAADESELASVMGHEIAHITQRHLPRMLAKAESGKLQAAAAILGAVLLGGQAGVAGLTVANAALISRQLAYTRDFEREADSIGIKLLAQAGFDPAAMGRFFGKLDHTSGLGVGDKTPEFLRTHPLSYTRIAEAENRAGAYPPADYPRGRAFLLVRAKIRALYSPQEPDVIDYFRAQAKRATGDAKDAAIYGIALAQRKRRQLAQARATLQPLLEAHPDEVAFQLAQAEIDLASGDPAAAVERYAGLVEAQPQLPYLTHYHAAALLANHDAAGAKRVLRHQLRRHKAMFTLYPLLSRSNAKLGLLAEAHQADAEFHAALGDYHAAVAALKLALRESAKEGYLHQSITARLHELETALGQR